MRNLGLGSGPGLPFQSTLADLSKSDRFGAGFRFQSLRACSVGLLTGTLLYGIIELPNYAFEIEQ